MTDPKDLQNPDDSERRPEEFDDLTWQRPDDGRPVYGVDPNASIDDARDPDAPQPPAHPYPPQPPPAPPHGHAVPPPLPPEMPPPPDANPWAGQQQPPHPPQWQQPGAWQQPPQQPGGYYPPPPPPEYHGQEWGGYQQPPQQQQPPYGQPTQYPQQYPPQPPYSPPPPTGTPLKWITSLLIGSFLVGNCCCAPIAVFGGIASALMAHVAMKSATDDVRRNNAKILFWLSIASVLISTALFIAGLVMFAMNPTMLDDILSQIGG